MTGYTVPLAELRMKDVESVGGKNASLGEMIGRLSGAGVRVPDGFATTAQAYRDFLAQDGLGTRIAGELAALDVDDVARLAEAGARIRGWILDTRFQPALEREVLRRREPARQWRLGRRRALLGDGRGPAERLVRRPAGDRS